MYRLTFALLVILSMFLLSCQNKTLAPPTDIISTELPWSERMALSIMKRNPQAWQAENDTVVKWDYKIGLLMTSFENLYEKTKNPKYLNYINDYANTIIDDNGQIKGYRLDNYNIDMINPGKFVFFLYNQTKEEKYLNVLQTLKSQLDTHPRTNSGGFWHKKIYPYQMWLDGLYMGAPFYAQYNVTFQNGDKIDDIVHQFDEIQKNNKDQTTGLFYHGWDESKKMPWANQETGQSPGFWGRALGWYAMALVDVLDYIPMDHPGHQILQDYLHELAAILETYQDSTGLWYQVPDRGGDLGNYLESSGSCMITYALAKGARKGYLSSDFSKLAQKAFNAIVKEFVVVDDNGEIHITNVCGSAGLGGSPYRDGTYEYYVNEKIKTDNLHGLGPFILASIEIEKLP